MQKNKSQVEKKVENRKQIVSLYHPLEPKSFSTFRELKVLSENLKSILERELRCGAGLAANKCQVRSRPIKSGQFYTSISRKLNQG